MARIIETDDKLDRGEPVAYVQGGTLFIRSDVDWAVGICLAKDSDQQNPADYEYEWAPNGLSVTRRYYRGDRITIEF